MFGIAGILPRSRMAININRIVLLENVNHAIFVRLISVDRDHGAAAFDGFRDRIAIGAAGIAEKAVEEPCDSAAARIAGSLSG